MNNQENGQKDKKNSRQGQCRQTGRHDQVKVILKPEADRPPSPQMLDALLRWLGRVRSRKIN